MTQVFVKGLPRYPGTNPWWKKIVTGFEHLECVVLCISYNSRPKRKKSIGFFSRYTPKKVSNNIRWW